MKRKQLEAPKAPAKLDRGASDTLCKRLAEEYPEQFVHLKESDMLEESVVYQDILQKGRQRGRQEGRQEGLQEGLEKGRQEGLEQGERRVALRLLEQQLGKLSRTVRARIERLAAEQLEALCDAIRDIRTKDELNRWLKQHAPARHNGAGDVAKTESRK